jgi:rubrerythrin
MPEFGNPFSGIGDKRPVSKEDLIRITRFFVAAEYEAVQLYTQAAEATDNEQAKKLFMGISREELVHAGEFMKLLTTLSPDESKAYQEGMLEAQETMSLAGAIRKVAKALTKEQQDALKVISQVGDLEGTVKQFFVEQGQKQSTLTSAVKKALIVLMLATGASNAQELVKEIKKMEVQAPKKEIQLSDIKKVSEALPMAANAAELNLLTNPVKKLRPKFEFFMTTLKSKMDNAANDKNLLNVLKQYSAYTPKEKSFILSQAFIKKVRDTKETYDFMKKQTFGEGVNKYLAELEGNHPRNFDELGLVLDKALESDTTLLNKLFR